MVDQPPENGRFQFRSGFVVDRHGFGSCVMGMSILLPSGICHRFCHICAQKGLSHVESRFPIARERRARPLTGPAGSREIVNDLI
jgi:hypothetical protein